MVQKRKRTKAKGSYSPSLKREIARRYLAGEFSYGIAAEEYGLRGREVVREMVRWYKGQKDYLALKVPGMNHDPLPEAADEGLSPDDLRRALAQARQEAHEARLAAEAWQTLVEQAERELQIEIVKKSGAKPCKK